MKRILFADDEENVLRGLKRMLRSVRQDWDVMLAESGPKALELMVQCGHVDVVISDMRMPGMDGLEFLTRVKEGYPLTVRFGLSGESDSQTLLRVANLTHQFLSKPCDPQTLCNLLARTLALRDHLNVEGLRKTLLNVGSLPSVPALYEEIVRETQSEAPSVKRIGEIIEKDPAMSAKMLQIVNSAYMGLRHSISDPVHAASLLGLENLKSIVLTVGVFSMAEDKQMPAGFSIDALWNHCLTVSEFARRIAKSEVNTKRVIDDSFTAGLLHDAGQIVLASHLPEQFGEALARSKEMGITLFEAEKKVFEATHAQVGGFLLELWGLPDPIIEAITFHGFPSAFSDDDYGGYFVTDEVDAELGSTMDLAGSARFTALAAVHAANYFCEDDEVTDGVGVKPEADTFYLDRLELTDCLERWWDICYRSQ